MSSTPARRMWRCCAIYPRLCGRPYAVYRRRRPGLLLKETMEEKVAIKIIGNCRSRGIYPLEIIREADDARYIGLVMPRVLGRLPYGPDTVPVRSFNMSSR